MNYIIPDITRVNLSFYLRANEECFLPRFKGSMIRGSLGCALRRLVCSHGYDDNCFECADRDTCIYTNMFEPYITETPPPFLKGVNTPPRPYIIDPFQYKEHYRPGDELKFRFTLFGKACGLYPYAVFSFNEAGKTGFTGNGWKFNLERVAANKRCVYDCKDGTIAGDIKPETGLTEKKVGDYARILFLTPLRIKKNGKWVRDISFRELVFRMARRILEMKYFHDTTGNIDWDLGPLLEKADDVEVLQNTLEWQKVTRESSRQHKKISNSGFTGSMIVRGNLEPFRKIFMLAEMLNVGKGAVFGMGKVRISNYQRI